VVVVAVAVAVAVVVAEVFKLVRLGLLSNFAI